MLNGKMAVRSQRDTGIDDDVHRRHAGLTAVPSVIEHNLHVNPTLMRRDKRFDHLGRRERIPHQPDALAG